MKTFWKNYGALLLCLVLAVALVSEGRYANRQIQNLTDRLDYYMADWDLYESISLAETKGLLRENWLSWGEIDWRNKTVPVRLSVVPWDYTLDTSVSVVCGGETIPLRQHGRYFRGELNVPLDSRDTITQVIVTQGGQARQAEVGWELMNHREFTPDFLFGGVDMERCNDGRDGRDIVLSGRGTVLLSLEDMTPFALEPDNTAGTFIKLVDGEEVEETPIRWEPEADGFRYRGEVELTVTQTQGQDTAFVVSMTDQRGITYRYTFLHYNCKFPGEYFYDANEGDLYTEVYAPNGDLLYTVLEEGSLPYEDVS